MILHANTLPQSARLQPGLAERVREAMGLLRAAVALGLLVVPPAAEAQAAKRLHRIGYITSASQLAPGFDGLLRDPGCATSDTSWGRTWSS